MEKDLEMRAVESAVPAMPAAGRKPYVPPRVLNVVGLDRQMLAASAPVRVTIAWCDYYLSCSGFTKEAYSGLGYPGSSGACSNLGPGYFGAMSGAYARFNADINDFDWLDGRSLGNDICRPAGLSPTRDDMKNYIDSYLSVCGGSLISFDGADWDAADFMANAVFTGCSGADFAGTYRGRSFTGSFDSFVSLW